MYLNHTIAKSRAKKNEINTISILKFKTKRALHTRINHPYCSMHDIHCIECILFNYFFFLFMWKAVIIIIMTFVVIEILFLKIDSNLRCGFLQFANFQHSQSYFAYWKSTCNKNNPALEIIIYRQTIYAPCE